MRSSIGLACCFLLLSVSIAGAAIIVDPDGVGADDISPADPSTWDSSTIAYIGYNSNGVLEVNGGSDIQSAMVFIAQGYGVEGEATIDGSGSTWTNAGSPFFVGYHGNGTLNVTNGGAVSNGSYAVIAHESDSVSMVTVSGGSTWTNSSYLDIGRDGDGTLSITSGGTVGNTSAIVGRYPGSSGAVTVTGSGSLWTNSDYLCVGGNGTGEMDITLGGHVVTNGDSYIGYNVNNNPSLPPGMVGVVTVDGLGSKWDNSAQLTVGAKDGNGTLNVTNGGEVTAGDITYVGFNGGTGTAMVTGNNSTLTTDSLVVGFNLTSNGLLHITDHGTVNTSGFFVSERGAVGEISISNGATLHSIGSTISNQIGGYNTSVGTGTVTVGQYVLDGVTIPGNGAELIVDGTLTVNSTGILNIAAGGTVKANRLVGRGGAALNLDGGTLETTYEPIMPLSMVASTNGIVAPLALSVTGNEIEIGDSNLSVSNGGTLESGCGYIGKEASTVGVTGIATIDGTNSTWTANGDVYIGCDDDYGTLAVTNGGSVTNTGDGFIGTDAGTIGIAAVGGANSTWTNSGNLYVGKEGNGTLNITDGGAVSNTNGYIGDIAGSEGAVTVGGTGAEATWTNSGSLVVGNGGNGTLYINSNGRVTTSDLSIGSYGELYLNGGTLELTGNMNFYGWDGTFDFNSGTIQSSSGASISAQAATVLYSGQALEVTDGSTWDAAAYSLHVVDGTLSVNSEGSLVTGYGYVGKDNLVGVATIDGTNSSWTVNGHLYVGYNTATGTLNITDGASVSNTYEGFLGVHADATGVATVSGGATWTSTQNIHVGQLGTGILSITDGGQVIDVDGQIGRRDGSYGTVTVGGSGAEATWENSGHLYVGNLGTGILNLNTNGRVTAGDLSIGSLGTLYLNGGTLELTDDMGFYGWDGTFNFNSGTIQSSSGASISAQAATVLYSGQALEVTGGSTWSAAAHSLHVVDGTLSVNSGGHLVTGYGYVGKDNLVGVATIDGTNSSWDVNGHLYVGYYTALGTLNIANGGSVSNTYEGFLGVHAGSIGTATVSGGATWTSTQNIHVGQLGIGILSITDGGQVIDVDGYVGRLAGSSGMVTVGGSGDQAVWENTDDLFVGNEGTGTLFIVENGLVSVGDTLTIDANANGGDFIKMSDGGQLALYGDEDDSLDDFLTNLVSGDYDAIQWYNSANGLWESLYDNDDLTSSDYSLVYHTSDPWSGYTILTVLASALSAQAATCSVAPVPEPSMLALVLAALAMLGSVGRRRRG